MVRGDLRGSEKALLQPLDDTVNYAVVVQYADPITVELAAEEVLASENGYLAHGVCQAKRRFIRWRFRSSPSRNGAASPAPAAQPAASPLVRGKLA